MTAVTYSKHGYMSKKRGFRMLNVQGPKMFVIIVLEAKKSTQ